MDQELVRQLVVSVMCYLSSAGAVMSVKLLPTIVDKVYEILREKIKSIPAGGKLSDPEKDRLVKECVEKLRGYLEQEGQVLRDEEVRTCAKATATVLSPTSWKILRFLKSENRHCTLEEIRKEIFPDLKSRSKEFMQAFEGEFSYRLLWLDMFYGLIDRCDALEPHRSDCYLISKAGMDMLNDIEKQQLELSTVLGAT